MAKVKKYHINANGEVAECKAFLTTCPFKDYSTQEAAHSALFLQKAANDLDTARENVRKIFNTSKPVLSIADLSGIDKTRTARDYADKLDRNFFAEGKEPELYSIYSQLKQDNFFYDKTKQKIYISSIPAPDYDNGEIVNKWFLEVEKANARPNDKKIRYELDLQNDFTREIVRAEDIIRETVIANSNHSTAPEIINNQTNFLKKQLIEAYYLVEEEKGNSAELWYQHEGYGTFKNSTRDKLAVNVDYQHSTFRGKIFDNFLNTNKDYDAVAPDEVDIRVYDNETGESTNSWGVRLNKGQWYIEARVEGKISHQPVNNADEMYGYLKRYIQNYMKTNDEETASKKAVYASDLMTDINLSLEKFTKKRVQRIEQEKAERQAKIANSQLYGNNNKGAMKSILGMFG